MKRSNAENLLMCVFLCTIIVFVYYRVGGYEFINYDDDHYVYQNEAVISGLSLHGIVWAFTIRHGDGTYWQPLAWLSHMLDCHLYGLNAGNHHYHSLMIHMLNSMMLFLLFKRMTDEGLKSLLLAAMFAVHPINMDSVVWISERKNLLSTFFYLSSMLAYVYYTRKPSMHGYFLIILLFVTGLLAKPMLVTLPFVLLLMDYWPLARFKTLPVEESGQFTNWILRLILEKVPLLMIAVVFGMLSKFSLGGNAVPYDQVSLSLRLTNAVISYLKYLGKIFWPGELSIHYPYPTQISMWQGLGAGALICFTIFIGVRSAKKYPYGIVFLLWYLGTLVPVSGLIQSGLWPAMADRWLYIPAIGLFGIIAWSIGDLIHKWHAPRKVYAIAMITIIAALMVVSWIQLGYWANSISIFKHALAVTDNNPVAHNNLGNALTEQGRFGEAIDHYRTALRMNPDHAGTHNNLGTAYYFTGNLANAKFHYKESLKLDSNNAKAHNNLGVVLSAENNKNAAFDSYGAALRINPQYAEAYNNLGLLFLERGKIEDAIQMFETALRLRQNYEKARNNLEIAKNALQP